MEEGRHVSPSRRTLGGYLVEEWLPAIRDTAAATTWGNWKVYAESYVVPTIGSVRLQELTAPQLQSFYARLLVSGRIKIDLSSAMYAAWQRAKLSGREPTARQVAEACGASIHTARAALRRFRAGRTPVGKSPGLEPKTVRNVHIMLHAALANAASWRYLVFTWENGRPVHPDVIRQRFSRLAQRCGLPHIRLHDMRHSYTTAALKAAST